MFHTQINGTTDVFSEKWTFEAHIDFCGTVPLTNSQNIAMIEIHKGAVQRKSTWALEVHFSRKTTMVPFIWA